MRAVGSQRIQADIRWMDGWIVQLSGLDRRIGYPPETSGCAWHERSFVTDTLDPSPSPDRSTRTLINSTDFSIWSTGKVMAQRNDHGSPETISSIQPCSQPSTTLTLIILGPEEEVDYHNIQVLVSWEQAVGGGGVLPQSCQAPTSANHSAHPYQNSDHTYLLLVQLTH